MVKKLGKKIENEKSRFIVVLPFVETYVSEYNNINHIGGTIATTEAGAVGNYLFRVMPNKARIVLGVLRDKSGGAGNYAMRVPDEFEDNDGNLLIGSDKRVAEEIEIATYLERCSRRANQKVDPRRYLDRTIKLLKEFDRLKA